LGLGATINLGALPAMAGGFTQPKGLTFTSFSFFTFDTDSFHKQELQIYLEYGLQDYLTILKSPIPGRKTTATTRFFLTRGIALAL